MLRYARRTEHFNAASFRRNSQLLPPPVRRRLSRESSEISQWVFLMDISLIFNNNSVLLQHFRHDGSFQFVVSLEFTVQCATEIILTSYSYDTKLVAYLFGLPCWLGIVIVTASD